VCAISVIAACSRNRVIGVDGSLPWDLPADLRRFRSLTAGHPVIMGRTTFESLPPRFRPLPDRRNLVVTRSTWRDLGHGVETFSTPLAALDAAGSPCFVIGGGQIYASLLPYVDRVYLTEVEFVCSGDTYFPELDTESWRLTESVGPVEDNGHQLHFRTYDRI
jgi:dihydrofolate reductase